MTCDDANPYKGLEWDVKLNLDGTYSRPISGEFSYPGKVTYIQDNISHPRHYNQGNIEPIDVIEDWKLGYCDGNALKYIARHKHKGKPIEDIKKCIWYLNRYLKELESEAS